MGKRKKEDNEEHIQRKIRRLERRLRRSRRDSSDDDFGEFADRHQSTSPPPATLQDYEEDDLLEETTAARSEGTIAAEGGELADANADSAPSGLPQDILLLLGEAKKVEPALGESIPKEISERWGKILVDGLAKENKEALLGKLLTPENFVLARAPKLNPEVAAVLTEPAKNRDKRLEKAQDQLGAGIVGIANLTNDLINGDVPQKMGIIKKLSEINQLLLNLHYEDTMNRRRLVLPMLDKNFISIIKTAKRDDFLFGEKLGENIKASKNIEKSDQQIRKPLQPFTSSNFRKFNSGNMRAPPRQYHGKAAPVVAAGKYRDAPQASSGTRRTFPAQQRSRGSQSHQSKPFNRKPQR